MYDLTLNKKAKDLGKATVAGVDTEHWQANGNVIVIKQTSDFLIGPNTSLVPGAGAVRHRTRTTHATRHAHDPPQGGLRREEGVGRVAAEGELGQGPGRLEHAPVHAVGVHIGCACVHGTACWGCTCLCSGG